MIPILTPKMSIQSHLTKILILKQEGIIETNSMSAASMSQNAIGADLRLSRLNQWKTKLIR